MSTDNADKSYLTPTEVAKLLMVSPVTVRQWAQKGDLPAKTTPGGHRRFFRRDVETFARNRGLAPAAQGSDELRILIVDDEVMLVGYLRELLEGESSRIRIETAHNGFDAGHKVHSFKPHAVLLDLMMPGLTGMQVCQALKANKETSGIRIVAMTGFASDEDIQSVLNSGAEACLRKPLDTKKLFDALGL